MYGGVETLLTTLARLRELCPGMEPHFGICFEGRFSRELADAGVPLHNLGPVQISNPWTVWRARRHLRELIHREVFDTVICHMGWTWAVFGGVAKSAPCQVGLWIHGFNSKPTWLDRLGRGKTPDVAISNSRFTAGVVQKDLPSTPIQVVYCPVPLVVAPEAAEWRAALRNEHAIGSDTTVIIQVGRMERWKGHSVHLHALAQLPPGQNWVCWIVGGPQSPEEEKYFSELHATAQRLGIGSRVKFFGQREDVPKLLAASDIFCQPNQQAEPFGLVFIEALWAGKPVLSSAIGGALEIVDDSCGLLVPPSDPDGLTKAISHLIACPELRGRMGDQGRGRARQLCDPETQMHKLKGILQGSIGGGTN
jgi:glycosyltransferase involved in cell wall biosynthesis